MHSLTEQLKNLTNNFDKEIEEVKKWYLANSNTYNANYLNEESAKKKTAIRDNHLAQAKSLLQSMEQEIASFRTQIRNKRYPATTGEKASAEGQLAEARYLLNIASESEEVIKAIELALQLERYDLVSYLYDTYSEQIRLFTSEDADRQSIKQLKSSSPISSEVAIALSKATEHIIAKTGMVSTRNYLLELGESVQICAEFIERISRGGDYFSYPYTKEYMKEMPKNLVSVMFDKVNFSMEIRGLIKPVNIYESISLK